MSCGWWPRGLGGLGSVAHRLLFLPPGFCSCPAAFVLAPRRLFSPRAFCSCPVAVTVTVNRARVDARCCSDSAHAVRCMPGGATCMPGCRVDGATRRRSSCDTTANSSTRAFCHRQVRLSMAGRTCGRCPGSAWTGMPGFPCGSTCGGIARGTSDDAATRRWC